MRTLVAGGTGAIGRPLTARLVAAGHEVAVMTRGGPRASAIEAQGARVAVADALDRDAVMRAVREFRPEAIVHQLTALPAAGPTRPRHLAPTNGLRIEGTDNLLAAAREAGVRRVVAQSIVFIYGYGEHGPEPIDETARLPTDGPFDQVLAPLRYMEERVLGAPGLEGITLRYGLFYAREGDSVRFIERLLRRRLMALPGGGHGLCPFVHLDDAAQATVRALEFGLAGKAYNVVDDRPASWADFVGEVARLTGNPPPRSVPLTLARLAMPYAAHFMARVRLPVVNGKARAQLGWAPAHPTFREGLAAGEPVPA